MNPAHENDAAQNFSSEQLGTRWMHHMRRGEWEAAWRLSDEVLRRRRDGGLAPDPTRPAHQQWIWNGAPLAGKRVLVRCYHGMGDTVQFIRLLPILRRTAAHTIVCAQATLLPLLRTTTGIDELLPLQDDEPEVSRDVDIELMELPHALRMSLQTLPRHVPYFNVSANGRRAAQGRTTPAVGIVWQSGDWDPNRSIPAVLMRRLTRFEAIDWRILQRGPALASLPAGLGTLPDIHDIMDEAQALLALDLLISVDTLSAHLGGALGIPTWTLLPADADWRWMEGREDTPWYPSMRLFRQEAIGGWERVIERVAGELRGWRESFRKARGAMAPSSR